jgi:hypothetical protein
MAQTLANATGALPGGRKVLSVTGQLHIDLSQAGVEIAATEGSGPQGTLGKTWMDEQLDTFSEVR